jgi:hypothetical protein
VLIDGIKRTRRLAYLLRKALHKEVDVETMQWLEQSLWWSMRCSG